MNKHAYQDGLGIHQAAHGGIYLTIGSYDTLLSISQLIQLRINLHEIANFNMDSFRLFYTGELDPIYRDAVDFGFIKNDKILQQYKGFVIIDTIGVIQIVDPESATRFVVDLDDSKMHGPRRSSNMNYEQQLKEAIDSISHKFEHRFTMLAKPKA